MAAGWRSSPPAVVAAVAALVLGIATGASPREIDYLVVEANEGGSSGGHAAVRFADETYHFQHEKPGILHLMRVDSAEFVASYALIENRAIHVSRVAVSDETFGLVRDAFNRRFLEQEDELEGLRELASERELLEALLSAARRPSARAGEFARDDGGRLRVPAAGLFVPHETPPFGGERRDPPRSPTLEALRRRLECERGAGYLEARSAALRAELAGTFDAFLPSGGAGRGYRDRFAGLVAFDILERAAPLDAAAHKAPAGAAFTLGNDERAWLAQFADRLEGDLVRLAGSDRPGWSFALLVGMARLVALRQSLDSGRLVVLDAFPDAAPHLDADALARQRHFLPGLLAEAHEDLAAARAVLVRKSEEPPVEADWSRVETAANRVLELEAAIADGRGLRLSRGGALVPTRAGGRVDPVLPDLTTEALARDRDLARAAERGRAETIRQRYAYNLLTRNCVTELFRVVDEAVPPGESTARLGGRVAPDDPGTFIPFVSGGAVGERYRVVARYTVPSYRQWRLAGLTGSGRDAAAGAWLREQSPLSSAIHHGNGERDSTFVFFTDQVLALRPALGAANLAVALGATATGLATAPWDGGRGLSAGLRGALFSLPELAFVSLRQGTFDHVPRRERESALAAFLAP